MGSLALCAFLLDSNNFQDWLNVVPSDIDFESSELTSISDTIAAVKRTTCMYHGVLLDKANR